MLENSENIIAGKHHPIQIWHFINPHMFWFRYDIQEHNANIAYIDFKVKQYYNSMSNDFIQNDNSSVEVNDIVAVHLINEELHVRAKVYKIEGLVINLWAIDYGYPIMSEILHIRKLPRNITSLESLCYNGGVDNVVPSKLIYNCQKEVKTVVDLDMWCSRSIEESRKFINAAAQTTFVLTSKSNIFPSVSPVNEMQLFGQLKITNMNAKIIDLAQHLKFLNLARECKNYIEIIRSMQFSNVFTTEPIKRNVTTNGVPLTTPSNVTNYNLDEYDTQSQLSQNNDNNNVASVTHEFEKSKVQLDQKFISNADKITEFLQRRKKLREATFLSKKVAPIEIEVTPNHTPEIADLSKKNQEEENSTYFEGSANANIERQMEKNRNSSQLTNTDQLKNAEDIMKISIPPLTETTLRINCEANVVLVHCKTKPKPIQTISQANFCEEIHKELAQMRVQNVYRIQSYAWPHLLRGNSLIVVGSSRSGRTLSYIPSVCSSIKTQLDEKTIPNGFGPLAIIICKQSSDVEHIANLCRRFFKDSYTKFHIIKSYGVRDHRRTAMQLLNHCDILVSTPHSFVRLLGDKTKLINTKRLQHVILDDIEDISQKDDLNTVIQKFLPSSSDNNILNYQFIVIAKTWQNYLERFLKASSNPMVCFGDFLEAAVYSKTSISINLTTNFTKISRINDFIRIHPCNKEKLLIVCNTDVDVCNVASELTAASYVCVCCDSRSTANDLLTIEEWKNKNSDFNILICTDKELQEVCIRNAQNLINYSLPSSWSKFKFRFSTLLDNYSNRIMTKFVEPQTSCLILLDEDNNTQLPKLIDFMEIHNQIEYVPIDILNITKHIKMNRERERIKNQIRFCPQLLDFGSCLFTNCVFRHILSELDESDKDIPKFGNIKLQILKIISPTHYTVRLLEHAENINSKWNTIRKSNEFSLFSLDLAIHMASIENQQTYWPVVVNDLCIYAKENVYLRCQIIKILKESKPNNTNNILVTIKLVDEGKTVDCQSTNLFILPKEFQDYPFQGLDLRLSGLVPYDNEQAWNPKLTNMLNDDLENRFSPGDSFISSIQFTILNNIWVDHLILMEKVESSNLIYKINLRTMLLKEKIATESCMPTEVIQSLAHMCGIILLPPRNEDSNKETETLAQFGKMTISKKPTDLKSSEITLNSKENEKEEAPVKKEIQSYKVKKNEQWSELQEYEFIKVDIGEFFTPHRFYIQNNDTGLILQKLEEMHKFIKNYQRKNARYIETPTILQNCLFIYEDTFCRAKITKINSDNSSKIKIFLCDYGLSLMVSVNKLYESNSEIINFMPFQAICCKLTGILPKTNTIWPNEICDDIYKQLLAKSQHTFVYPIKLLNKNNELNFNTYEIILLNCDGKSEVNINKEIIKQGWAEYDNDTKHYLDLVINRILIYETHDMEMFENQQSDDMETMNLDVAFEEDQILSLMNVKEKGAKIIPIDNDTNTIKPITDICNNSIKSIKDSSSVCIQSKNNDAKSMKEKKNIKKTKPKKLHLLKAEIKSPRTIWYQNDYFIVLKISAPDVEDYTIHINDFELVFSFENNFDKNLLIINFLGTINSELSYYQMRGLNMIVWLQKGIGGLIWPRLTLEADKWYWLTNETTLLDTIECETINPPTNTGGRISEESELEDDDSDTNIIYDDHF